MTDLGMLFVFGVSTALVLFLISWCVCQVDSDE